MRAYAYLRHTTLMSWSLTFELCALLIQTFHDSICSVVHEIVKYHLSIYLKPSLFLCVCVCFCYVSLKFWGLREILRDKYKLLDEDAASLADFLSSLLEV